MMSPMRASGMFRSSSYPKPDTPENISTISSPRKVRPNVSRKALVNAGSALGTTILQITAARLIRKLAASFSGSRGAAAAALVIMRNMGSTPEKKANAIWLVAPSPRNSRNSGNSTTLGML